MSNIESMKKEKESGQKFLIMSRSSTTKAGVTALWDRAASISMKRLHVEIGRRLLKRGESSLLFRELQHVKISYEEGKCLILLP
jgi:hypothetical protein